MAKESIFYHALIKRGVEFGLEDAPDDSDNKEEEVPEHFTVWHQLG